VDETTIFSPLQHDGTWHVQSGFGLRHAPFDFVSGGGDGRVHAQGRAMSRMHSVARKNGPPSLELAQFGFQAGLLHHHSCCVVG
jgi:hypothetical protein